MPSPDQQSSRKAGFGDATRSPDNQPANSGVTNANRSIMASLGGTRLMKPLTLVLIACFLAVVAPQAFCNENRLHLTEFLPETNPGRLEMTALSAERDVSESGARILHLKGDVEVRMITCGPDRKGVVA